MRAITKKNYILLVLLMAGLIFNILWSARLDSAAQELSAKMLELNLALAQNRDLLSAVNIFQRSVPPYSIQLDDKGIGLSAASKKITMNMQGVFLGDQKTQLGIEDEGIGMHNVGADLHLDLDTKSDSASLYSINTDLNMGIYPKNKRIELQAGSSVVRIGEGSLGKGVELGEFDTGTFAITKGKGVGIKGKESLQINFDGDIEIKANGNIRISSAQGTVRINGTKIYLNE